MLTAIHVLRVECVEACCCFMNQVQFMQPQEISITCICVGDIGIQDAAIMQCRWRLMLCHCSTQQVVWLHALTGHIQTALRVTSTLICATTTCLIAWWKSRANVWICKWSLAQQLHGVVSPDQFYSCLYWAHMCTLQVLGTYVHITSTGHICAHYKYWEHITHYNAHYNQAH